MRAAFESYWVDGIPDTVLIDREGRLVERWTGFQEGMEAEVGATIEAVLGERER